MERYVILSGSSLKRIQEDINCYYHKGYDLQELVIDSKSLQYYVAVMVNPNVARRIGNEESVPTRFYLEPMVVQQK